MDAWARDVVLHHHQRYDGGGYPATGEPPPGCGSLAGEDIPLAARITAVADVYDALASKRVYKPPMSYEGACDILRRDAGSHFDPVVVEAFLSIQDVVLAIRDRYAD
ncbi:HD domain-containing phosphohydrolase [Solidesulfovibrio alcoholivorans]|uniref:HD domain-containing phosphohydrolase n=1 Tax=Solidesulfovibrio alcoholivorans TaxID=81406 RepID=UPI0012EB5235